MKNLSILALVATMATPALAGPDHRNFIDQVIKSGAGATASVAGVSFERNSADTNDRDQRKKIGYGLQR
jgi:hypothetical protein